MGALLTVYRRCQVLRLKQLYAQCGPGFLEQKFIQEAFEQIALRKPNAHRKAIQWFLEHTPIQYNVASWSAEMLIHMARVAPNTAQRKKAIQQLTQAYLNGNFSFGEITRFFHQQAPVNMEPLHDYVEFAMEEGHTHNAQDTLEFLRWSGYFIDKLPASLQTNEVVCANFRNWPCDLPVPGSVVMETASPEMLIVALFSTGGRLWYERIKFLPSDSQDPYRDLFRGVFQVALARPVLEAWQYIYLIRLAYDFNPHPYTIREALNAWLMLSDEDKELVRQEPLYGEHLTKMKQWSEYCCEQRLEDLAAMFDQHKFKLGIE